MLTPYRPAMPFGNYEFILEDLFSSELLQFKKYYPSGNLKFNNLDIFQSLNLRNLIGKILRISLKLNFTPNFRLLWINTKTWTQGNQPEFYMKQRLNSHFIFKDIFDLIKYTSMIKIPP